ncbi:MAG: CBS domain-containing protein [Chloroflexi bacterium]|nr:MAG: CBS domain-containing protein [Chloroflexota bacterium]MBL1194479.1 CBS domain-containing protein [Chloroflexota bacterium]NOH11767.1 CBS domain-containing protein [Chloroflexota bacterium]
MFVADRMSSPPLTIHADDPMQEALNKMKKEGVRRFPVVDKAGKLLGIVSESDLLHASPSDATTLSMWELNYMLSKIKVKDVMTSKVTTVNADTPIEEAARIMSDSKIGGLPVLRDGELVGIITETDLFKTFLELMGARDSGVRLSVLVKNAPGQLANITKAIYEAGGDIITLGTFMGESSENSELVLKVDGVAEADLKKVVEPVVEKIVDLRTVSL